MKRRAKFRQDKPVKRPSSEKGYTLHRRRILDKATRSIKFPILIKDEDKNQLIDAAISDYRHLFGPLNYSDWEANRSQYSIVEFWIDMLCTGAVFQPSYGRMINLAKQLSGKSTFEQEWNSLSNFIRPELIGSIREPEFINFLSREFRKSSNPRKFIEDFLGSDHPEVESIAAKFSTFAPLLTKTAKKDHLRKALSAICGFDNSGGEALTRIASSHSNEDNSLSPTILFKLTRFMLVVQPGQIENVANVMRQLHVQRGEISERDNQSSRNFIKRKLQFTVSYYPQHLESVKLEELETLSISEKAKIAFSLVREASDNIKGFKQIEHKPEALFGLESNFNSLSNFLGEFSNTLRYSIDNLVQQQLDLCSKLEPQKKKLEEVLKWLARRLSNIPEKPAMENSWAEYRSLVGGKIQSWFTNYLNFYREDLKSDEATKRKSKKGKQNRSGVSALIEKEEALRALISRYQENSIALEQLETAHKEVSRLLSRTDFFSTDFLSGYAHFQEELFTLNESLNPIFRQDSSEENNSLQKKLSRPLPRIPQFFGERTKERYIKAEVSPKIAEFLTHTLMIWLKNCEPVDMNLEEQDFQKLLNWTRTSPLLPVFIKKSHNPPSWLRYIAKESFGRNNFWVSPFSRRRVSIIEKPRAERPLKALTTWLVDNQSHLIRNEVNDVSLSVKLVTLLRITVGFLRARNITLEPLYEQLVSLEEVRFLHPALSKKPVDSLGDATFYRAYFSELEGLLSISRPRAIIERVTLQSQSGAQNMIIFEGNTKRFLAAFPRIKSSKEIVGLKLSTSKPKEENFRKFCAAAEIRSSRYQLSFLYQSLNDSLDIKTEAGGASYILESKKIIKPHDGRLRIESVKVPHRAFISVPFEINRVEKRDQRLFHPNRFMGVDIGEYAVAYCVVEKTNNNELRILSTGVVRNGAHAVLKDKVEKLKRRQRSMTFGNANTSIAEARKSLVGNYRNKLHGIALEFDAKIVYEFEVNAFESGGNRIKKVYETLKKSDCRGETDADKKARSHVWGLDRPSADEIGAYLTSQTCAKCRRSYLNELNNFPGLLPIPFKVADDKGRYSHHEFNLTESLKLCGYLRPNQNVEDKESLRTAVKAFMRPPLLAIGKKELPKNARRRRGNSSIFRCPYSDCRFVADADVQAAYIIALKNLYRPKGGYPKDKDKPWQSFIEKSAQNIEVLFDRGYYRAN